ncbi:hypothetical protein B0H11DRAFT_2031611 [Mycena galericulata]|nr:hypothetical protein B0H11DRAFT_2031611 [Mycena galericulata]
MTSRCSLPVVYHSWVLSARLLSILFVHSLVYSKLLQVFSDFSLALNVYGPRLMPIEVRSDFVYFGWFRTCLFWRSSYAL